jgi:SAM-dependent methyltransferase
VGIDVSTTSVAHTETLRRKYGLTNLEVRQSAIEDVVEWERRFDLIVCTGVLHHLVDPDAGLRVLGSVLKAHGAIYLMVYAPYGRAGVYMLQEYCRRLGVGTSDEEIRDLASTLEALPAAHPLAAVLRASRDAANADALADALLNPRDRAYSVAQLYDLIESSGLTLRRWYWQAPYLPQCGAIAATPHANRMAVIAEREQHAAMELWRGTMTCHSAVVCRPDAGGNRVAFGVDDEGWRRLVPHRLPWKQMIEERRPPGAAAVLLNRSHAHHDLILPIGVQEKRLFEAIDGRRSIGEILDHVHGTENNRVRTLFEQLWSYDQVVFDASA